MKSLLVLMFSFGGQSQQQPVGLMLDREACVIAGAGMKAVLEGANPGLRVEWLCTEISGVAA